MKLNISAMATYSILIGDCEKEILYWNAQPDAADKIAMLNTFNQNRQHFQENYDLLENDIDVDSKDEHIEDIEKYIGVFETILEFSGHILPKEIKSWMEKAIRAIKRILEKIKIL